MTVFRKIPKGSGVATTSPPDCLDFENYRQVVYKWHYSITRVRKLDNSIAVVLYYLWNLYLVLSIEMFVGINVCVFVACTCLQDFKFAAK